MQIQFMIQPLRLSDKGRMFTNLSGKVKIFAKKLAIDMTLNSRLAAAFEYEIGNVLIDHSGTWLQVLLVRLAPT